MIFGAAWMSSSSSPNCEAVTGWTDVDKTMVLVAGFERLATRAHPPELLTSFLDFRLEGRLLECEIGEADWVEDTNTASKGELTGNPFCIT